MHWARLTYRTCHQSGCLRWKSCCCELVWKHIHPAADFPGWETQHIATPGWSPQVPNNGGRDFSPSVRKPMTPHPSRSPSRDTWSTPWPARASSSPCRRGDWWPPLTMKQTWDAIDIPLKYPLIYHWDLNLQHCTTSDTNELYWLSLECHRKIYCTSWVYFWNIMKHLAKNVKLKPWVYDGNTLANSNGLLVGNWHIPPLHGLETIGTSHDEPVHGK